MCWGHFSFCIFICCCFDINYLFLFLLYLFFQILVIQLSFVIFIHVRYVFLSSRKVSLLLLFISEVFIVVPSCSSFLSLLSLLFYLLLHLIELLSLSVLQVYMLCLYYFVLLLVQESGVGIFCCDSEQVQILQVSCYSYFSIFVVVFISVSMLCEYIGVMGFSEF